MTATALADLAVVEVGQGAAAAFAAKALADLGADVIKVEPPGGDAARYAGPFPGDAPHPEKSGRFLYLNANKRGVTLDLDREGDRAVLLALLNRTDILISDLAPRRLDELGLNYPRLGARCPRLIATCISPFGQTGPYRDYAGSDLIAWHMGGTGHGTPFNAVTRPEQQPPLRGGGTQAEYLTGWTAATATMAAVFHRERTGCGQLVDISAMESVANMVRAGFALYAYDPAALPTTRLKAGSPWIYPCKDGYISMSTLRDHWWEALKDVMGRPDWAESPSFADVASRRQNADALDALLAEWLATRTREELFRTLVARGIPCFPVNPIADVLASPQYRARDYFVAQEHPVAGRIVQPGASIRLSRTPWQLRRPAPLLGEHTDEVLATLEEGQASVGAGGSAPAAGVKAAASAHATGALRARGPHTSPMPDPRSPLAGVRILDFGWILSVPHCTAWLGTLGAEVLRVESSARLDLGRMGLTGAADGIPGVNRSATFNGLNYSKQSITLNIATPEGRELARELVKVCDVVTENFATGVLDRLGLGYKDLCAIKPDIIMLTGSTLGTTGPEREATGWGPNVCAYAGLPYISGYPDGPPADLGGIWPDYMIGTMMVFALLSALHHQRRTGEGQHVEIAMGEVVTAMIPETVLDYTMNGRQRQRMGNRDDAMAPHGVYPCKDVGNRIPNGAIPDADPQPSSVPHLPSDAWLAIACATDAQWRALCQVAGHPEWADDSRFVDAAGRKRHEDALDTLIGGWTRDHTAYELMHALQAAGVVAGPVMSISDLVRDPHLHARGFLVEIDHPEVGPRRVAGLPARFSAIPVLGYTPAPCLGEHNARVFGALLARDAEEIRRLHEAGVIA